MWWAGEATGVGFSRLGTAALVPRGRGQLSAFLVTLLATTYLFIPCVVVDRKCFAFCNSFGTRRVPFCVRYRRVIEDNGFS